MFKYIALVDNVILIFYVLLITGRSILEWIWKIPDFFFIVCSQGTLDTKEYIIRELAKGLGLDGDQMCVLVALLGNYVLPESELADLHRKLSSGQANKVSRIIRGFGLWLIKIV